jgi:hypothetical protein
MSRPSPPTAAANGGLIAGTSSRHGSPSPGPGPPLPGPGSSHGGSSGGAPSPGLPLHVSCLQRMKSDFIDETLHSHNECYMS